MTGRARVNSFLVAVAVVASCVAAGRAGAAPRPSAAAPIYVAKAGSDSNPGTSPKPLLTIRAAVARAKPGSRVVISTGVYREALGTIAAPITLEAAPGATVWLSGADVVRGWVPTSGGWVHHGWTAQFCRTCYDPRALDAKYPNAGLPDQVFIDDKPLAQVARASELRPGTFAVDYATHDLYMGDDPTGASTVVEASARVEAARFSPTATGSTVRGIGFKAYAPDWNASPSPAMVTVLAANTTFDRDVFVHSASRGLSVYSTGSVVRDSAFLNNGFTGLHATKADRLVIQGNLIANNNTEKWWPGFSPVASVAGVKIANSRHVLVKGNVVQDNYANGVWFDVSSYDANVVNNLTQRNLRNGIYIEITGTSVVASNLSVRNGQAGVKLSGATDARVYNNTLADNLQYQLSVHDDGRNNTNEQQIALGITWNTARNSFVNNIFAAPDAGSTGPLLYTENLDKPKIVEASTMITSMAGDVFARAGPGRPSSVAYWTHKAPAAATKYATLAKFAAATGYEPYGVEYTGYTTSPIFTAPKQGDYSLLASSPLRASGFPLPSDIAALVGAPCTTTAGSQQCTNRVNRGALVHP